MSVNGSAWNNCCHNWKDVVNIESRCLKLGKLSVTEFQAIVLEWLKAN